MQWKEVNIHLALALKKEHSWYLEKLTLKTTLLAKLKAKRKKKYCELLLMSRFQCLVTNLWIVSPYSHLPRS